MNKFLHMRINATVKKEMARDARKAGFSLTAFVLHLYELYKKKWRKQ